jgi:hypothetical protein
MTTEFDPTSKTVGDMILPGQFMQIKRLAKAAALDPDEECRHVLKCKTEDLSVEGARWLIAHLERCVEEFKNPRKVSLRG